jgi:hypothetical protein
LHQLQAKVFSILEMPGEDEMGDVGEKIDVFVAGGDGEPVGRDEMFEHGFEFAHSR